MKLLLTIHHFRDYAGTERFIQHYAGWLKAHGHEVFIFSPYLGNIAAEVSKTGIKVSGDIKDFANIDFDIIHAQHNHTAILARAFFPTTPIIFMAHGVIPELEQPPSIDIGLSGYIAVSEEVKAHLVNTHQVPEKNISVVRNVVNTDRFKPQRPVNSKLKEILVLSNHYKAEVKAVIEKAAAELKANVVHVGMPDNPVSDVENYLNAADLVITLGRGVLEAMACERNILIYDQNGGDGMLTSENFVELRKKNFSGRTRAIKYDQASLVAELRKYSPDRGIKLRQKFLKEHLADSVYSKIVDTYNTAISKPIPEGQLKPGQLFPELYFLEMSSAHFLNALIEQQQVNSELSRHFSELEQELTKYRSKDFLRRGKNLIRKVSKRLF